MKLYTIGFTQKSARQFFDLLQENGVQRVVDIRLHTGGQLSGFAKQEDLRYFLKELIGCDYIHLEQLAPSAEILESYRSSKDRTAWEAAYIRLLDQRSIPASLERSLFEEKTCCLLCSEAKPDHCHRRLAAERLARDWGGITIHHL
jgi:uncharacterized protein (DUF488 family)